MPCRFGSVNDYEGLDYHERDTVLLEMGYGTYGKYLKSETWRTIKSRLLTKDTRCCYCSKRATVLHHEKYTKENLAGTDDEGIVPSCKKCHSAIEFGGHGRKRSIAEAQRQANRFRRNGKSRKRPGRKRAELERKEAAKAALASTRDEAFKLRSTGEHRYDWRRDALAEKTAAMQAALRERNIATLSPAAARSMAIPTLECAEESRIAGVEPEVPSGGFVAAGYHTEEP